MFIFVRCGILGEYFFHFVKEAVTVQTVFRHLGDVSSSYSFHIRSQLEANHSSARYNFHCGLKKKTTCQNCTVNCSLLFTDVAVHQAVQPAQDATISHV